MKNLFLFYKIGRKHLQDRLARECYIMLRKLTAAVLYTFRCGVRIYLKIYCAGGFVFLLLGADCIYIL